MAYNLGDKIICKKKHPCGSFEWTVVRVGADYKIKCSGCGRVVMLNLDELKKITKKVVSVECGEDK